ncbi:hypothetical protein JANAI62_30100 [Jannaschia pagri]|uniref:Peptidase inhibitor I78 family protein n=1 Tax=Jannaschia pagri TaxID=2829797 RepID=A0ABQ4NQM5_9RHOB|nr:MULTISPECIES: I78 family peptidase inhibitor [unclassified Jannaschia]GIT92753.1 hypothetical protein JANAI61_32110 [Jannaschia sp. AI_61]GIT96387.1 hypothetical protein JANAI62_30100 [Jannaschia sp. AI_62]
MRYLWVLAAMGLTACNVTDEGDAPDACGASEYASLVGANIAAVSLPAEVNDRVIGPDTIVTQDYVPTRLNIRTDAQGVILALDCG